MLSYVMYNKIGFPIVQNDNANLFLATTKTK